MLGIQFFGTGLACTKIEFVGLFCMAYLVEKMFEKRRDLLEFFRLISVVAVEQHKFKKNTKSIDMSIQMLYIFIIVSFFKRKRQ